MSSPLDGRIRSIARAEAAAAMQDATAVNTATPDSSGLQQQIEDLHNHLHRLDTDNKRLAARITELEKAAGQPDQEQPAMRRTRRKTGEADA